MKLLKVTKKDIDLATHILAHYVQPSVGTSMEIIYAWERNKPVLVVTSPKIKLSPWLSYHSKIFYSFQDAIDNLD
jgi:translation initiation factor 2B subunit (eIF-2B alpha/beta/delta family)